MSIFLMSRARLGALGLAFLISAGVQAVHSSPLRVEPPNWWVDFAEPEFQIMLYGPNIQKYKASVEDSRVTLTRAEKVKSPNYLFLHFRVNDSTRSGPMQIRLQAAGQIDLWVEYPLFKRSPNVTRGFSSKDAVLLITPDRFVNADAGNDHVPGYVDSVDRRNPGARHGGDIAGIIQALDYVHDMGYTQIWPTPLLENKSQSYSYHGYAITDFYKVDPRFGDLADYKNLANRARAKGIGLIKDLVLNHIGAGHWWMQDLPTDDWLNRQQQSFAETNHKKEALIDPYGSKSDLSAYVDHWFVESMPDLNQRNPLLAQYLTQNALWWVETLGLSGYRVDTYSYSDRDFLGQWSARMQTEYPTLSIVAEEWHRNPVIVSQWQRGKRNHDGYRSSLQSLMDFRLYDVLADALTLPDEKHSKGLVTLYGHLVNDLLFPAPQDLMIFGDNHDTDRLFRRLGHDPALLRMALAYLATMRGIPQIYYGTEALLANSRPGDHGEIRSDLPGGFTGDTQSVFTGHGLSAEQRATQTTLKQLLNWRKTSLAVQKGELMHYVPDAAQGTYVYFRYLKDEPSVMVALNKSKTPVELSMGRFHERARPGQTAFNPMTGEVFRLGETLTLPARGALILEIRD